MNYKPSSFIFFLLFVFALAGYSQVSELKSVKVIFQAVGSKEQKIRVKATNMLKDGLELLKEGQFNVAGECVLEMDLPKALFLEVAIGNKNCILYLSPGDNLQIFVDFNNQDSEIKFKGRGAVSAEYLKLAQKAYMNWLVLNGESITTLPPTIFVSRLDSLDNDIKKISSQFSGILSANSLKILNSAYKAFSLYYKLIYTQGKITKNKEVDLPLVLKNINNEIPLDTLLLSSGDGAYSAVLAIYWMSNLYKPFFLNKKKEEITATIYLQPIETAKKTKEGKYPPAFEEFFLAKNIYNGIKDLGVILEVETILNEFKKKFPNSPYLPTIQKLYNEWSPLSKGKIAPEILGKTPEGKKLSLSDLKGKIVYIDVWATWCGPCIAEFPSSKKLQQQFNNNKEVVFLYVSVDENEEKWKKFLSKEKNFGGTHINQPKEGNPNSIWKNYLIYGIPRYILIDQKGLIVDVNAPRPSSGKLQEEIQSLLIK
ncbi:MAG: TlpA disulfide reductase family protein [Spirosomataceae bacterium]